jgi:Holliday junction DNA helicase RuvA
MIGSVRGKVILKDGNYLIVETGGVGYRVLVSSKVSAKTKQDDSTMFYTYTLVREDELSLFGFPEVEDLKLFENLISVSGVGPKTAMSVFSVLERGEIINAVMSGDTSVFSGIPRLGTKNAQKIIIELKSKLGESGSLDVNLLTGEANNEVIDALMSFGFTRREVGEALGKIDSDASTSEEKIKLALKYLGK